MFFFIKKQKQNKNSLAIEAAFVPELVLDVNTL